MALGFEGDFANSAWTASCADLTELGNTFNCGFAYTLQDALVSNNGPKVGPTATISSWANASRPSGNYLLSFDLSLSYGPSYVNDGVSFGYFQVGGSGFSPTGQVSGFSVLEVRNIYASANQPIQFGISTTNSFLSSTTTDDLQLSISG